MFVVCVCLFFFLVVVFVVDGFGLFFVLVVYGFWFCFGLGVFFGLVLVLFYLFGGLIGFFWLDGVWTC